MAPIFPLALALCLVNPSQDPKDGPQSGPSPIDVVSALETVVADTIAAVEGSVVAIRREKNIQTGQTTAVRGRNPEPPRQFEPRGAMIDADPDLLALDYGSGVVVGNGGEILTAFHVVRGARYLEVRGVNHQRFEAEVIAADPRSDLAVIAPRDPANLRLALKPVKIGDSGKLRKGAFLLAFGNPFNSARDGMASASMGILSNRARRIDSNVTSPDMITLKNLPSLLQMDAKLNLGMSGGAVVNLRGELVGLTTNAANVSGFDAQAGYAIPMDQIGRRAVESLIRGKEVEYGFLGIGLDEQYHSNAVGTVQPGTPADEAGLVTRDRIISIGGIPVLDSDSLILAVNSFTPGTPIEVKLLHNDKPSSKFVNLSKLGVNGEVIATSRAEAWRGLRVDYVSTMKDQMKGGDLLAAMARGGVLVSEVQPASPAEVAGLRTNQVILAVDGQRIRKPADFDKAIAGKDGPVELTLEADQKVSILPAPKP